MTDQTKPCMALMGEFSAGKSTLANLLLGEATSPVQVTATQMPPVRYRHGAPAALRHDPDGSSEPILDGLCRSAAGADHIEVFRPAPVLERCDLIDMPGTSDPNLTQDFWKTIIPDVDVVIWCSAATQAWRQSEAALWEEMPPGLHDTSILLLTRIDKIRGERDQKRVLQRVRREADGLFHAVLPAALLGAKDAPVESGYAALLDTVTALLDGIASRRPRRSTSQPASERPAAASTSASSASSSEPAATSGPVIPRRVQRPLSARPRPERSRPERPSV